MSFRGVSRTAVPLLTLILTECLSRDLALGAGGGVGTDHKGGSESPQNLSTNEQQEAFPPIAFISSPLKSVAVIEFCDAMTDFLGSDTLRPNCS